MTSQAENLPLVSVVIPVRNEALILRRCLVSLQQMEYPKDRIEVIVVDGMSTDNLAEVTGEFGVKRILNERRIVVSARNLGFSAARGEIIAFTDADCVVSPGWIGNSLKYFRDEKVAGVGGLSSAPPESSCFEKAVDAIFSSAAAFGATAHLSRASSARETRDIPGCNAIYRRKALAKVMPVDENLLTAEDVWMNAGLRKAGYKLVLAGDVTLCHYRRSDPKRFFRQVYRFAIGRFQVSRRDSSLLSLFHVLAGLSLPFYAAASAVCLSVSPNAFFAMNLALIAAAFALGLAHSRSFRTASYMPLAAAVFFTAWSAGFLRELFFPIRDSAGK